MANRYFIAIVPPEPLQSELMEWKNKMAMNYNSRGALRSPAHITLHMPFEMEGQKEKRFLSSAKEFIVNSTPFIIQLKGFGGFEPRVIFIDVEQNEKLIEIRDKTVEWMKTAFHIFNQSDDKRGFHPHITIGFRDLKKVSYYKALDEVQKFRMEKEFFCENIEVLKFAQNKWETAMTIPLRKGK
jgi:2'-5' RNA ligase